jgi:hypothetical protein
MKQAKTDDRVGDLLEVMGAVTREQLADAVAKQKEGDPRPLGALLIELGYATSHDVELALMRQQARRGRLKHDEGMRVLDEAHESTKRAAGCFDELASAANELGKGEHR